MASEDAYAAFLRDVRPLHFVRPYPAGAIISGRSWTRRQVTVDWLAKHGMSANEIVLAPWSEILTRDHGRSSAEFKAAEFIKRPHLRWFVESDPAQAQEISKRAKRTTICPTTAEVFGAEFTAQL